MLKSQIYKNPLIQLVVLGGISALAFAPYFFFLAQLIAFPLFLISLRNAFTLRDAFERGVAFGFGHFVLGLYWVGHSVLIFADEFWWFYPFAVIGLPLILSMFIACTGAIAWCNKENNLEFLLSFITAWVVFEWIRNWIFTGFPWNMIGYTVAHLEELIQIASIGGVFLLSFIILAFICSPYLLIMGDKTASVRFIPIIGVAMVIVMAFGAIRLKYNPTEYSQITVRVVQPSIPQVSKWTEASYKSNLLKHINLSRPTNADIIIWPEAAITVPNIAYNYYKEAISILAPNQLLMTGIVRLDTSSDSRYYTSIMGFNHLQEELFHYDKAHLVPFGEYVPWKEFLPLSIKKITHGLADYTEGTGPSIVQYALPKYLAANDKDLGADTEISAPALFEEEQAPAIVDSHKSVVKYNNINIRPLICYEGVFPLEVITKNNKADIFMNITNDAWFGGSAGPYQHFYIERLRAVESGLPMIRASNNGISSIIDPVGRIIKATKVNEETFLESKLPVKIKSLTLYSMIPPNVISILMVMLLLVLLLKSYIRIKK